MRYDFEWDSQKAKSNLRKHGISFEETATAFKDPNALSIFDNEHSINEERWITLGISSSGKLLVICHGFQKIDLKTCVIRIFSSRKATKKESKQYR
ncbi:MAG: BrnT family toxin [Candidatus Omnitrophota bacterium]